MQISLPSLFGRRVGDEGLARCAIEVWREMNSQFSEFISRSRKDKLALPAYALTQPSPKEEGTRSPLPRGVIEIRDWIRRVYHCSLRALELTHERSAATVIDIIDAPSGRALRKQEDYRFLFANIYKRGADFGIGAVNNRLANGEVLDLEVLRVVKRITVNHPHLAFRLNRVLPNEIRERLREIFIYQSAAAGLKERSAFQLMRPIEIGYQSVGCIWRRRSWLSTHHCGTRGKNQSQDDQVAWAPRPRTPAPNARAEWFCAYCRHRLAPLAGQEYSKNGLLERQKMPEAFRLCARAEDAPATLFNFDGGKFLTCITRKVFHHKTNFIVPFRNALPAHPKVFYRPQVKNVVFVFGRDEMLFALVVDHVVHRPHVVTSFELNLSRPVFRFFESINEFARHRFALLVEVEIKVKRHLEPFVGPMELDLRRNLREVAVFLLVQFFKVGNGTNQFILLVPNGEPGAVPGLFQGSFFVRLCGNRSDNDLFFIVQRTENESRFVHIVALDVRRNARDVA